MCTLKRVIHIIKHEAVLIAAAILAVVSAFFVAPDAAYLGYINWSVLAVLFCLMTVVAGFRRAGAFDALSRALLARASGMRMLSVLLVMVCFFTSALITNDVALITFVPFTIGLLGSGRRLIRVVVLETVAANLGSMLTPVGNPQNLYLYSCSGMDMQTFLAVTGPLWLVSLVLVVLSCLVLIDKGELECTPPPAAGRLPRAAMVRCSVLFVLSLLTVLRLLDWRICLAVTVLALLLFDRKLFACADYSLLASFVCFFILVGNLARIDAVHRCAAQLVRGHEMLAGVVLSQVISNVPAAAMLAPFTENYAALIRGVNLGGLGTLLASMASLISYRFYSASEGAERGRYLLVFTIVNVGLLALLVLAANLLYHI